MATETLVIRIQQTGAKTVSRNLSNVGKSAGGAGKAVRFLARSLAGLGIALGGVGFIKLASEFQNLRNRVRLFSDDQKGANQTLSELVRIAGRARQDLSSVGVVFQRLAIQQDKLGLSTERLLPIVETIAKSIAIGGSSAQEAAGALRQFGQALSGNFQRSAQELNSIIEQTPGLTDALASGLEKIGVASNITGLDLKRLVLEGLLTSANAIKALEAVAGDTDAKFAKISTTFAQGFTQVNNALTVFIGRVFETTGAGTAFTKLLSGFAEGMLALSEDTERLNGILDTTILLLKVLVGLAVTKFMLGFAAAVLKAGGFLKLITGSRAAQALVAIGRAAKAAAISLLLLNITPLGLLITAIGGAIALVFAFRDALIIAGDEQVLVRDVIGAAWDIISESVDEGTKSVQGFVKELTGLTIGDFANDTIRGIRIIDRSLALLVSRAASKFLQLGQGIANFYFNLPKAIEVASEKNFAAAGTFLSGAFFMAFEDEASDIMGGINAIINDELAQDPLGQLGAAGRAGAAGLLPAELERRARERAARRAAGADAGGGDDIRENVITDPAEKIFSKEAINARQTALDRLRSSTGALVKEQIELKKATKILDEAVEAKIITDIQSGIILAQVAHTLRQDLLEGYKDLKDELDPVSGLTREHTAAVKELDLALKVNNIEIEEHARLMALLDEKTREAKFDTEEFQETLTGTSAVLGGVEFGVKQFAESFGNEFTLIRDGVSDSLNLTTDAIIEFTETGTLNFRKFATSVIALIQQVIIKILILKALTAALNTISPGLGDATFGVTQAATAEHGGPVTGGQPVLVGERGPEILTPPRSANVTANDDIGGANVTIINVASADEIPAIMATKAGQEVIINTIQLNKTAVKGALA